MNAAHTNTVIIVCGPTAVGKTSLAIALAQQYNTSIISADSRQCFTELNIGVAKPTAEQLRAVPHYFINTHHISQQVNAAMFEQYALRCCTDIFLKNPVAIMAGGTGLYIKAFCEGIDVIPEIPAEIRNDIQLNYAENGLEWLQSRVQQFDPLYWQNGEQQNPHRLMRALEVIQASGKSILDYHIPHNAERPFKIIKIGLELSRAALNQNINTRVDQMMKDGLLDETRALLPHRHLNALQTVGYRELFDHFEGLCTLTEAVEKIKISTRQYAKRQMTWFKKDTTIRWHGVQL